MRSLDVRFSGYAKPYKISGDYGERDPPVPIPNTEVKPFSADGTWLETTWESRTLPDSMKKGLTPNGVGSFFISSATSLRSGRVRRSQRTYLVRFIPVRRLWRKQHGDEHLGEQEAERRSNFVHLKKSFFQIIPTNVQHYTWLGFFLPPAVWDAGRKNHMGEQEEGRERNVFHFGCNVLMLQSSSMKSENVLG